MSGSWYDTFGVLKKIKMTSAAVWRSSTPRADHYKQKTEQIHFHSHKQDPTKISQGRHCSVCWVFTGFSLNLCTAVRRSSQRSPEVLNREILTLQIQTCRGTIKAEYLSSKRISEEVFWFFSLFLASAEKRVSQQKQTGVREPPCTQPPGFHSVVFISFWTRESRTLCSARKHLITEWTHHSETSAQSLCCSSAQPEGLHYMWINCFCLFLDLKPVLQWSYISLPT